MPTYDAVLVVSFGGPERPEDVMPFLENVVRGRNVPRERLEEVAHHYDRFGGVSPINEQNRRLAAALEAELAAAGMAVPVYLGNRNWHPLLADTIATMKRDGVTNALALIASAYSSYSGCRQYREDIESARGKVSGAPRIDPMRRFFNHPGYLEASLELLREAVGDSEAHVAFTAHSIPLAMASTCDYEAQLRSNAEWLASELGVRSWRLVWQSRSGPPSVPWLEPDVLAHLTTLAVTGVKRVVLAPIGFVSDHMEVVYDLDVEAKQLCERLGIELTRARTVGTHPRFVAGLRELVQERVSGAPRLHLGPLPPRADVCEASCCPKPVRPTTRGGASRPR